MQRRTRSTPQVRAAAIGLTLLAHVAALLFLAMERRAPRREALTTRQFVSLWPQPPREQVPPLPITGARVPVAPTRTGPAAPRTITLPGVEVQPVREAPAPSAAAPVESVAAPRVDWSAAAGRAAARVADAAGRPDSFGPPLQALPEPCVPRVFDKETKRLMNERFPERPDPAVVGANPHLGSMIVGGRPMAVQKITIPLGRSEPRGDLFENMDEKRKVSSVPSPHVCD